MKEEIENPPAFPSEIIDHQESAAQLRTVYYDQETGMTLRDYFAAKAMHAHLSSPELLRGIIDEGKDLFLKEAIAIKSYEMANEMLKQRMK